MPKYIYGKEVKTGFEIAVENMLDMQMPNNYVSEAGVTAPHCLFDGFWREEELAVLFAGSGLGKSVLAVQIADMISKGTGMGSCAAKKQKVLFFDFELNDRQFAQRYGCGAGKPRFNENFLRVVMNAEYCVQANFRQVLYTAIENAVVDSGAKVLVVDSFMALKSQCCFYGREEVILAQQIRRLQKRHKISVLLVTQARDAAGTGRLTLKSMEGCRYMAGFADSVFALGCSSSDANERYILQLKSREPILYNNSNVWVCRLTEGAGAPRFEFEGHGTEKQLLMPPLCEPDVSILVMKAENPLFSLGEIAKQLNTNKMRVKRVLEKYGFKTAYSRNKS